jgi:hypothetical protein
MEKVLVMKHEFDGMAWNTTIPESKFMEFIKEHTNEDAEVLLFDDMRDAGKKVSFEYVPADEYKESCINGIMFGEGCEREEAEKRYAEDLKAR